MSLIDPLGDMITRIRNAYRARLVYVDVPLSRAKKNVLDVLLAEGYVSSYECVLNKGISVLRITLKYSVAGEPALSKIQRVSTPGRRVYSKISALKPCFNGMGVYVLSTSLGILSDSVARSRDVGGEVLCVVF